MSTGNSIGWSRSTGRYDLATPHDRGPRQPDAAGRHAILRQALRRGDPQGALLDECHRVPQRSVPQSRVGAGTLSHRTGRDEVPLPGHQGTGPQGHRADTMDHTLEAGVKRLRSHIRGPDAQGRGQLNINMKIAVYTGFRTDPLLATVTAKLI